MSLPPSTYNVIWSPAAFSDLDHIETFIGAAALAAARRTRQDIVDQGDSLRQFPLRAQILRGQVRRLVIEDRYLLRFRVAGAQVRILGVRDGRRR